MDRDIGECERRRCTCPRRLHRGGWQVTSRAESPHHRRCGEDRTSRPYRRFIRRGARCARFVVKFYISRNEIGICWATICLRPYSLGYSSLDRCSVDNLHEMREESRRGLQRRRNTPCRAILDEHIAYFAYRMRIITSRQGGC